MSAAVTRWFEKNRYAASSPALSNARGRLKLGSSVRALRTISSRLFNRSSLKFESATSATSAFTSVGSAIRSFDHACSPPKSQKRESSLGPLFQRLHLSATGALNHERTQSEIFASKASSDCVAARPACQSCVGSLGFQRFFEQSEEGLPVACGR